MKGFSKTISRVHLYENAVLMLSCGRVKMKLFEKADVTVSIRELYTSLVSIYCTSEHAFGFLGITRGNLLVCFLSSKFECRILLSITEFHYRTSNFECHSVFVWTGIFSKPLLVWTRIFFHTDKKDAFSKYPKT